MKIQANEVKINLKTTLTCQIEESETRVNFEFNLKLGVKVVITDQDNPGPDTLTYITFVWMVCKCVTLVSLFSYIEKNALIYMELVIVVTFVKLLHNLPPGSVVSLGISRSVTCHP